MSTKTLRKGASSSANGGATVQAKPAAKRRTSRQAAPLAAAPKVDAESLRSVPLPKLFPDLDWSRPMAARAQAFLRAADAMAAAGDWILCAEYAEAAQRCAARADGVPGHGFNLPQADAGNSPVPSERGAARKGAADGAATGAVANKAAAPKRAAAQSGAAKPARVKKPPKNAALSADAGWIEYPSPALAQPPVQGVVRAQADVLDAGDDEEGDGTRASLNGVEVSEVWYERVPPQPFDWSSTFERPWEAAAVEATARERLCALARHAHPRFVLDWTESALNPEPAVEQETRRSAARRARAARLWVERVLEAAPPAVHIELCGAVPALVHAPQGVAITRLDLTSSAPRAGTQAAPAVTLPMARKAAAAALPLVDASVDSLSCLSVIEHVGLDVLPDEIDYDADLRAVRELRRVVAPGGQILLAVPLGQPRLPLHGPRIYSYRQVLEMFRGFELSGFALLTDGQLVGDAAAGRAAVAAGAEADQHSFIADATESLADRQHQALGCFRFVRPLVRHGAPFVAGAEALVRSTAASKVPAGDAAGGAAQQSQRQPVSESQATVFLEALACGHGLKTLVDVGHLVDWPSTVHFDQVVHIGERDAQALTRSLAGLFKPALVRVRAQGVAAELLELVRAMCQAPERGHAMLIEWAWDDAGALDVDGALVPSISAADLAVLRQCVAARRPAYQVRQAHRACIISSGVIPGDPALDD